MYIINSWIDKEKNLTISQDENSEPIYGNSVYITTRISYTKDEVVDMDFEYLLKVIEEQLKTHVRSIITKKSTQ